MKINYKKNISVFIFWFSCHLMFCQTWQKVNQLGMSAYQEGNYKVAVDYFEQAKLLALKEFGAEHMNYANSIGNLSLAYSEVGEYKKSEALNIEAAKLYKKILGEGISYATSINNLATLYVKIGKYSAAESLHLEALSIREQYLNKFPQDYAASLNNLSLLYSSMGDYGKAEIYARNAIEIYGERVGKNTVDYAKFQSNLGLIYAHFGNFKKAEGLYLNSLSIYYLAYGENHPDYIYSLNNLGSLYENMDSLRKAAGYYLVAVDKIEKNFGKQNLYYTVVLNNLAGLYKTLHDYNKAEQLFKEVAEIKKEILGVNNSDLAISFNNLAEVYHLTSNFKAAEAYYLKAIDIIKVNKLEHSTTCGNILENLSILYMEMDKYDEASPYMINSLNIFVDDIIYNFRFLTENEKEIYVKRSLDKFDLYFSFFQRKSNVVSSSGDSYNLALFSKGLILQASVDERKCFQEEQDKGLREQYDEFRALKSRIYQGIIEGDEKGIDSLTEAANSIEKKLIQYCENFRIASSSSTIDWQNIRTTLKFNEAAIEFVSFNYYDGINWTDSIFYAALLLRSNDSIPIYIPLFEERQLAGLMKGDSIRTFANLFYSDAQVRNVDHDITYCDSLYQIVWEPINEYLVNIEEVTFSPTGLLNNVAFDAIMTKEKKHLGERYRLNRVFNTGGIIENNQEPFKLESVALFGGLEYDADSTMLKKMVNKNYSLNIDTRSILDSVDRGSIVYLPGSKVEVDSISKIFAKRKVPVLMYAGLNGIEENFKSLNGKKSPSILHLSTHGFFFKNQKVLVAKQLNGIRVIENPLFRCGLLLTGAEYAWRGGKAMETIEDGILTGYEIANIYLPNTELVVMSACETGLGEIEQNEGVYGLQRAFKMAGVKYIIVSLWQILDKETSEFMIVFYKNLSKLESILNAFQATQLEMKNKYRDEPYKWAGFVLIK